MMFAMKLILVEYPAPINVDVGTLATESANRRGLAIARTVSDPLPNSRKTNILKQISKRVERIVGEAC